MHTPGEVATALGIAAPTLRKWSTDLARLLSPQARRAGAKGRRYSDDDVELLRHYQKLLHDGATYEQARAALVAQQRPASDATAPVIGAVEVIQPSDETAALQALIAATQQIVASQRQHIEAQERLIAQLQQQSEHDRAALDQVQQRADQDRADLILALERARADEARALEALRAAVRKIPRWLRGLLGLGV